MTAAGGAGAAASGLSEAEAARRVLQDGPNALPVSQQRTLLRLLAEVVTEPMFLLLVACGTIYLLLGDRGEALMLLGFVFVVMGITFSQQRRAENALAALRDLSSPTALTVRDGAVHTTAASALVCGDIVLISEGNRVPADLRLLESSNLALDESMLTGESATVAKFAAAAAADPAKARSIDPASQVYSGTLVTQGNARGEVIATGARSALGRIGASLAAIRTEPTPIQQETRRVVKRVALVGLAMAAALAATYWYLRGDWLHGLLAGLTFAMAILPEELPVILTIFLGLGAWRLAREQVLARRIPAIELLGATTVLCVDKTGTLTMNRMVVRALWTEAAAYDAGTAGDAPLAEALHGVLEYAVLASHRRAFDPMESAIGAAGAALLAHTEHLHRDWTLLSDYPLTKAMLAMSRVWQSPDQRAKMIAAKGAPEAIIDLCHLEPARSAAIAQQVERMAAQGLRVLGVAMAVFDAATLPGNQHDFDFQFLGLIALEDPVRPDVPAAIAECRQAGIRVVMITGDHPATALSIARQAGLAAGAAITGVELDAMDDAELARRLADSVLFCRVQPAQKLRLVQAFRARGDVVAMTGDGVNDAPALKAADIGVAMGARGTDVARESSALVLLNDDFGSLLTAVRHGRRLFANLRKAIVFVVAAHVPIVGLSILPVLFGWPMLLMPVHVLFLQLIIDPACSVVFEAEPLEADAMQAAPRRPDARLFDRAVLLRGLWQGSGLLLALVGLSAVGRALAAPDDAIRATMFGSLVLANLGLIYVNRAWSQSTWRRRDSANPTFIFIVAGALMLLALVLGIAPLRALFVFALPGATLASIGVCASVLSVLWFETVKRFARTAAARPEQT
ncbi:cation-translocating P-type ATPase [Massilia sp. S19_KUP03_FR1]|uniref:cation-translocating P-type ATPase n=1 Tax=Massilia sp. S19_KUP03_FR1 TaxID=3025503 RepID=UPI002FCD7680